MALPYSLLYPLGLLLLTALQSHCTQSSCPPQLQPPGSGPSCLYVKPSEGDECPSQLPVPDVPCPCHTLDEYAKKYSQCFASDQRVIFLNGTHYLNHILNVTDESNLIFLPYSDGDNAEIFCNSSDSSIIFEGIQNLTLTSLSLTNCCGGGSGSGLSFHNVTGLTIEGLTLTERGSVELTNVNISHISKGIFCNLRNSPSKPVISVQYNNTSEWLGNVTLLLEELIFENNTGPSVKVRFLGLIPYPSTVHIEFQNVTSVANNAKGLKDFSFFLSLEAAYRVSITINDSRFQGTDNPTTGIHYSCQEHSPYDTTIAMLNVTNSFFSGYRNSSLYLITSQYYITTVSLENVSFSGSTKYKACSPASVFALFNSTISLKNVTFHNNRVGQPCDDEQVSCGSALWLLLSNAYISNCTFLGNSGGTALTSVSGRLSIAENVFFINNSAESGGAMTFYDDSHVILQDGAKVLFQNNTAFDVGGAIYVSSCTYNFTGEIDDQCFITNSTVDASFDFVNNNAINGGDDIYGAMLSQCYVDTNTKQHGSEYIKNISNFSDPDDMTSISSQPTKVCLCKNSRVNCSRRPHKITVYPGQLFNVSAALVGDMDGTTGGIIYAQVISDTANISDNLQSTQQSQLRNCTVLHYSLVSDRQPSTETLILKPTAAVVPKSEYYPKLNSLRLTVNISHCPSGFQLKPDSLQCGCNSELTQINVTCNITAMKFTTYGTVWIGKVNQSSGNMYYSKYCPYNYCRKDQAVDIVFSDTHLDQDAQCAFSRSGILCGGCPPNHSLALGSNRCLKDCSDNYLALLIVFALAGVALVFFIKIFNLTITKGTINGLIFYANIVAVDPSLFFPTDSGMRKYALFIISWLNLDFGIETCFFKSMDGYTKVWLQFVFPTYVLLLAFLIIVVSHYSVTASKIFGKNSVPVLATLIVLSYSKFLRTIAYAVAFVPLQAVNGSEADYVWQYDGNLVYLGSKLIPLCIFAYVVLFLALLPFTIIMLCIQWILRFTHIRGLRWIVKLIPFFDAFTGPFKSKHRYWIGVLLITRCILIVIYSASGQNRVPTQLGFVAFSSAILLYGVGHVYKSVYLTLLECASLLNLCILAIGTFYVRDIRGNQEALAGTSVIIASLLFIAVVVYHSIIQFKQPVKYLWRKRSKDEHHQLTQSATMSNDVYSGARVQRPLYGSSELVFSKYREPLFEHLDTQSQ